MRANLDPVEVLSAEIAGGRLGKSPAGSDVALFLIVVNLVSGQTTEKFN